ncbi:MAG: VanZ family protein [Candidatus Korobacteraceae bacterium]
MLKPTFRSLVRNWWLVIVWLGVIRMESTDTASAANTTVVLYKVIVVVAPHVKPSFVQQLDEVLRKSGHFLGYGILSVLVFLALRNTNRDRLRPLLRRSWGIYLSDLWRAEWVLIGMLATVVTASFDEIHQTFIPSRQGRWQDVVLDTVGAAVLQVVVYLLSTQVLKHRQMTAPHLELTSTR